MENTATNLDLLRNPCLLIIQSQTPQTDQTVTDQLSLYLHYISPFPQLGPWNMLLLSYSFSRACGSVEAILMPVAGCMFAVSSAIHPVVSPHDAWVGPNFFIRSVFTVMVHTHDWIF